MIDNEEPARSLRSDDEFDRLLPDALRARAAQYFTPVHVARRAAEMLVTRPGVRILDVGAGVGKFCLVGAAFTPGVFVGVEQRPHLVSVAERLTALLGGRNVAFVHGDVTDIDWTCFDGFYLFNPFNEHVVDWSTPLDNTIDLALDHYVRYVDFVTQRLEAARPGTRVVTYHGFGAALLDGYDLAADEESGTDRLQLWVKEAPSA